MSLFSDKRPNAEEVLAQAAPGQITNMGAGIYVGCRLIRRDGKACVSVTDVRVSAFASDPSSLPVVARAEPRHSGAAGPGRLHKLS